MYPSARRRSSSSALNDPASWESGGSRIDSASFRQACKLLREPLHDLGMLRSEVDLVQRILTPIEELVLRAPRGTPGVVDELPALQGDREGLLDLFLGRGHAAGRLGDGGPRPGRVALALQEGNEAGPLDARGGRHSAELEQGRHDVDRLHHLGDALPRRHAARPPEEQRDVGQLAVHALLVERPAVLEELLAVVAREHDEGAPVEAQLAQPLDDAADLGVHGADRAVVPVLLARDVRLRDRSPRRRSSSRVGMTRGRMTGLRMRGLTRSIWRSCSACPPGSKKRLSYGGSGLNGECGSATCRST